MHLVNGPINVSGRVLNNSFTAPLTSSSLFQMQFYHIWFSGCSGYADQSSPYHQNTLYVMFTLNAHHKHLLVAIWISLSIRNRSSGSYSYRNNKQTLLRNFH
jgi:hypothetical protein